MKKTLKLGLIFLIALTIAAIIATFLVKREYNYSLSEFDVLYEVGQYDSAVYAWDHCYETEKKLKTFYILDAIGVVATTGTGIALYSLSKKEKDIKSSVSEEL